MMKGRTLNYVDRYLMTMRKQSKASKTALNLYGNLGELYLHDVLLNAYWYVGFHDPCRIQLLQFSAELLYPTANF